MNQLWQRDNITDLLLERIVFFGQIEHYPFAVRLMEFRFIGLCVDLFVDMPNVVQCIATHIDFIQTISKRFELQLKSPEKR